MHDEEALSLGERWARLRFAIVAPVLAAPPEPGRLREQLEALSAKTWRHPITGEPVRFSFSTVERWYYTAQKAHADPVGALRPRRRADAGRHRRLSPALRERLRAQYTAHPSWSAQLHTDNLAVLVAEDSRLGPMPSYATIRRYLRAQGLARRPRRRRHPTAGMLAAEHHLASYEVRSYELAYVNALWHADFHVGSRNVLTEDAHWHQAQLLGILDDCSRLCCHAQWYLHEDSQCFVHGMSQGMQKRGLPRGAMTDCGKAENAAEVTSGFSHLGVHHQPTLPYSPYQNAKQEVFWTQIEGRLLPMLEGVEPLRLDFLNRATLAWVEREYNRSMHRELGCTPLERYLQGPDVARECPDAQTLRRAFRTQTTRVQRKSDGTCTLDGRRFEVPNRFRHLQRLTLRYARWDLACIELLDPHTELPVAELFPLDKTRNAESDRRALDPVGECEPAVPGSTGDGDVAPLLKHLMAEYAATGLPPAYLPFDPKDDTP